MLSRAADALYWMGRYVERAEHVARLLGVSRSLMIDFAEVDPAAAGAYWAGTLTALGVSSPDVTPRGLVRDEKEPGSIARCIGRARENARQVREVISSEMWEHLNAAYWSVVDRDPGDDEAALEDLARETIRASFLFCGVTDATMRRGEGWDFVKLGQLVERADRTSHLLTVRVGGRPFNPRGVHDHTENLLWLSLLRSCCALEAYRKVHPARVEPRRVLEFLVLDASFPRSIRHALAGSAAIVARIGTETGRGAAVGRSFGRLGAVVEFTEVEEVLEEGVGPFLGRVREEMGRATLALQRTYFLH
ncbi:MAG: alpha-E domain-containing protein [Sandaracinaceae bacterium]